VFDGPTRSFVRSDRTTPTPVGSTLAPADDGLLPRSAHELVGRESDLEALSLLLAHNRAPRRIGMLTLFGPGGCGKTTLAVSATKELCRLEACHPTFVALDQIADPALVVTTVARALGVPETTQRNVIDLIIERIRSSPQILILDNCEHVLDAAADLCSQLLAVPSDLRLIATSQERLRITGETVYAVGALSTHDARSLYIEIARESVPTFDPSLAELAQVDRICQDVDGLPLGIVLAAAWADTLTPAQIEEQLDDLWVRGGQQKQRSVVMSVEWSYGLLDDDHKRSSEAISVFVGRVSAPGLAAVCGVDDMRASRLLAELKAKAILRDTSASRELPQYVMPDHIRRVIMSKHDVRSYADRHASYFFALVEAADPMVTINDKLTVSFTNRNDVLQLLDRELPNVRAALAYWEVTDQEQFARLVIALGAYWSIRGLLAEARRNIDKALAVSSLAGIPRARLLETKAEISVREARSSSAITDSEDLLNKSAALYEGGGDAIGYGHAMNNLGDIRRISGDFGSAQAAYRVALRVRRREGLHASIGFTLANLARLALARGQPRRSRRLFDLAELEFDGVDLDAGRAYVKSGRAEVETATGDYASAEADILDFMAIERGIGDLPGLARALELFSVLKERTNDTQRAATLAAAAMSLRREMGQSRVGSHESETGVDSDADYNASHWRQEVDRCLVGILG
jgi:predicted ATPase